jgi:Sec-independent protein translocase protein TatA
VFGAKRLPEIGRSLGSGLRGFKESISGEEPSALHPAEPAAVRADELTMPVPAVTGMYTSDAGDEHAPVRHAA